MIFPLIRNVVSFRTGCQSTSILLWFMPFRLGFRKAISILKKSKICLEIIKVFKTIRSIDYLVCLNLPYSMSLLLTFTFMSESTMLVI